MELNENNIKGYTPIEPDIYDQLNWDYDCIVSCLEYIRTEIPTILNIDSDNIDVFLVSFSNFLGQKYPAIGIRTKEDLIETIDLNYSEIEEKIENWIENLGIENLKQKAKDIKYIDWKTLESLKEYPNFQ
ncbi:hypothetical protein DBB36_14635 [Flavobacterium sp. WLB]|uniref:hypothetical protein n=1 Tax=unclassified Flavobacterium TaxID=196869 RepID=UPI0006ABED09|nr:MULTISPECIES: hypothetical protein [unclassified Flavobacterium]KOP39796.1 hypothetical protein AKO67_02625 [Flavobacterium sp. VMW]OWU92582.1 hypothetical protein APR43_00535 [Flavobacterium sp. NLM]PUU69241.1 hypothetical protein DBB36_14635 [Flavobacterium sp. WLB]